MRTRAELLRPEGLPESLERDTTVVMGILNVTPDSFSDGGRHDDPAAALDHARRMLSEGAAIIDVGGESTRPGAQRVDAEEELRRVLPVVRALAAEDVVVSVDTMRASVAEAVVEAGALILNDVSGGAADERMPGVMASSRTRLGGPPVVIAMHWRGHSDVMNDLTTYQDAPRDVARELGERLDALREAGVENGRLVADPGLGFSKTGEQNWEVLGDWDALRSHGLPVLIGASRKRFLARLGGDVDAATAAVSQLSGRQRAWAVRVHDVASSVTALTVQARYERSER
ncbi:dihydropteroate synthase [Brachybacterium endophyticum]|uniref:Dihydropteroate synthase n=1 Tax=Brachybacterium endophyticum TaxID=2182385 RepID=A0A2U2RMC4_9MICO|nr:dihydropteroate synthase [Brachybacterium endophyticum]PWH06934.1 dihydropteroate synthase [Brachybacterium endophyticum]